MGGVLTNCRFYKIFHNFLHFYNKFLESLGCKCSNVSLAFSSPLSDLLIFGMVGYILMKYDMVFGKVLYRFV